MNARQIKASRYPEESRVATDHGMICFKHIHHRRVLVVSGKNVGWFQHQGRPLYAALQMERADADSPWTLDPTQFCVAEVSDGMMGANVAPDLRETVGAVLIQAFHDWMRDNPALDAQVRLCDAKIAVFQKANRIRDLECLLERERAELERLKDKQKATEKTVARVRRAMTSDRPAPAHQTPDHE